MKNRILKMFIVITVLVLAPAAMLAATPTETKTITLSSLASASSSERASMENALRVYDDLHVRIVQNNSTASRSRGRVSLQTNPPSMSVARFGSHAAMVLVSGNVYDNRSLEIRALIHTRIPQGSLIGLRVRRFDIDPYLEGVGSLGCDFNPGDNLVIKELGGGTFFDSTKQYELVIVDTTDLSTTVDYIPVVSGGPFIKGGPQTTIFKGDTWLVWELYTSNPFEQVNAIVINGTTVLKEAFIWGPGWPSGSLAINLDKFGKCFDPGRDTPTTIVKDGQSDTTGLRFPWQQLAVCSSIQPSGGGGGGYTGPTR